MNLFTIGYEGRTADELPGSVAASGITTVVDVRDLPLSRKRGFSKTALASLLAGSGVGYVHERRLGNPTPLRRAVTGRSSRMRLPRGLMDLSSSTSRFWRERILITVKTYPTPHPTHHEAVYTAGINEAGEWRRLWPIPFRYLEKGRQFRRYEWIDVALRKQSGDPRPESHVVDPDTIVCDGFVDASRHWGARRAILVPHAAASIEELQDRRTRDGTSMGL